MNQLSRLRRSLGPLALALLLVLPVGVPALAADPEPTPSASPDGSASPEPPASVEPAVEPAADPTPEPTPTPTPEPTPTPLSLEMRQQALSHDAATNRAQVRVTATPTGAVAPWRYSVAVRGSTVASGETSDTAAVVTVTNNCSITTQSVTVTVTDAAGRTAGAAATLDRSLCPPPPSYPHASDRIIAGPTLTEDSFVDRLRAVGSPALPESRAIYRTLVDGGVNPAFALGTFHAESHSGTRGYAVTTRNWGNILYYSWEAAFGAVPYAPGNGYTYAKYPTWLASVRAYVDLLQRYHAGGYTTVSSASAHWLGTVEGSTRHLTYLNNITGVMRILPDDAVPVMRSLTAPSLGGPSTRISWSARDNLAVTGYQVRWGPYEGAYLPTISVPEASRVLAPLASGKWKVAVRATDAAGNWSAWRYATFVVDATPPTINGLRASQFLVSTTDRTFGVAWSAVDGRGVTGYEVRYRNGPDGTWSASIATSSRSRTFKLSPGSWFIAVRARDAMANWSAWREVRVIVPSDDRGYAFSAGTVRSTSSSAILRTVTTTRTAGASLTVTFNGTSFSLLGPSGPGYGRMRVTVDGKATIVDAGTYRGARATVTRHRTLLFSQRLAAGDHVVVIRNLATAGRPVIGIDAIGLGR